MGEDAWSRWGVVVDRGGPHAAEAVRRIGDPAELAKLVASWIGDERPAARRALECYLERPLDTFGHEVVIKRWFHQARRCRDHEVMGWLLVAMDRSIRRETQARLRQRHGSAGSEAEAKRLCEQWRGEGWSQVRIWRTSRTSYHVAALGGLVETLVTLRRMMPRDRLKAHWVMDGVSGTAARVQVPEWSVRLKAAWDVGSGTRHPSGAELDALRCYGLFSQGTRLYLRRACWRYFRELGRSSAEEYTRALAAVLVRYRDEDTADSQNLLDNHSLMHVLFHESGAVSCLARGWRWGDAGVALEPAPAYGNAWLERPELLLDVAAGAASGVVRQWAATLVARAERDHPVARSVVEWCGLLAIPELAGWAGRRVMEMEGISEPVRRLLERILSGDTSDSLPAGAEESEVAEAGLALLGEVAWYWWGGPPAVEQARAWRGWGEALLTRVDERLRSRVEEGPMWVPWLARWLKTGGAWSRREALRAVVSYGDRTEAAAHVVRRFIPRLRWV